MKHFTLLIFFVLICFSLAGQDLVITTSGDSIECRISQVRAEHIIFIQMVNGRYEGKMMELVDVADYQYNYLQKTVTAEEKANTRAGKIAATSNTPNPIPIYYKRSRVGLSGGFSYQLADKNDDLSQSERDYEQNLKRGYHFAIDIAGFVKPQVGIGVKASLFKSKNQTQIIIYSNSPFVPPISTAVRDNISIFYIGPAIYIRNPDRSTLRNNLLIDFSLGYLHLNNDGFFQQRIVMTGYSAGFTGGLAYEISLSDEIHFFIRSSLMLGVLGDVKVQTGGMTYNVKLDSKEKISLSRIDLSFGLSF